MIYKICPLSIWREAECQGSFSGAGIDPRDGYIHFSTAVQLRETAARHFAGQDGSLWSLSMSRFLEAAAGPKLSDLDHSPGGERRTKTG
jgi:uncharacterized protein (DUF952 family)